MLRYVISITDNVALSCKLAKPPCQSSTITSYMHRVEASTATMGAHAPIILLIIAI